MEDKVFEVVGYSSNYPIVRDRDTEIRIHQSYNDDPLMVGDIVTIEVFGEKDGYKQAVVDKIIKKVERPDPYKPKTIKNTILNSNELMEKYKTKENLIEDVKKEYANNMNEMKKIGLAYAIPRQEKMDEHIKKLENCLTWEELAEVYNNPPISNLR